MIDPIDYKEPACALCDGKEFYNPELSEAKGRIPVKRVMEKTDSFYAKNDLDGAMSHLEFWLKEAESFNDKNGELSVLNELLGVYRKKGEKEKGLFTIDRAIKTVKCLQMENTTSAATVLLNAATAFKAFGAPESAIPLYEDALKIYNEKLDKNDPLVAGLYNNYALSLIDVGEKKKAEELFYKAIKIMENAENGYPDAAISYINLAHLYENYGNDKNKITDCMFKAYNLLCDENNDKNPYLAFVYDKCYPSFGYFGYTRIAEELKKESEEIYARS